MKKAPKLNGRYQVSEKIVINAKQETVWQVLKDFANVYTWAPSVKQSYALNEKQEGVGIGRHCKLDGFGDIDEYVTQWKEGSGFVYDVTPLGPINNAFSSWWLHKVGDSCTELEVVLSYDLRFGLFGRIMHKLLMRKKLESSLPDGLKALKTRVETGRLIRPLITEVKEGVA